MKDNYEDEFLYLHCDSRDTDQRVFYLKKVSSVPDWSLRLDGVDGFENKSAVSRLTKLTECEINVELMNIFYFHKNQENVRLELLAGLLYEI